MKTLRTIAIIAALVAVILSGSYLTGTVLRPAGAISTSDILKVGGVLLVVNQLGDDIDHFVNKRLSPRRAEAFGATKVVPIFSVGQGAYIGAAQVVGVPSLVKRVQGVGVSAVLDVKL